jgi:hypothetical protein
MESGFDVFIRWLVIILFFIFWLAPLVLIYRSEEVGEKERTAWIFATLFVSWFSWVFFLLLAPLKPK